jgi:hypothetical protein
MRTKVDKDFRIVFANAFRVRVGDNDCSLTFIVETDDSEGQHHSDQVQIVLTPRTLKIINFGVEKALERLEALTGTIHVPEEKLRALEAALGPQPQKAKPKS